jgi:hypothetical protein
MVSYLSQSKGQGLAKSLFVAHHPFRKVFLQQKEQILHLLKHLAFSL